ncbi:nucleoside deaminase [Marinivivus vitaminiproducens]|uniref:nucleoside deaminase n=1 Tax=Marinivivus vitaminiproducens TaxID=3035935 RepID=UPI00279FB18B|nr:nucleoside deaminase [Geminicoccaceae bacterium SCSIO 64248]
MSTTDEAMRDEAMRRAIALSRQAFEDAAGEPFGAVVVRDGQVLGEGRNRVAGNSDPTAHAEVEAIRAACRALGTNDLGGAVMVTSCEPCPMCTAAILYANMAAVVYANDRDDAASAGFDATRLYEQIARPPAERDIPHRRASADEARRVFDAWTRRRDRPDA